MIVGNPTHDEPLLLLLSSGLRTRYREDILRALTMPYGAHLQFRYSKGYLSNPKELWEQLSKNRFSQHRILVVYVDAANKQQPPNLIPCRYGLMIKSEAVGGYAVLKFELGDFAYASDLGQFQGNVTSAVSGKLPYWDDDPQTGKRKMLGDLVQFMPQQPPSCNASRNSNVWQLVTDQLQKRNDFSNEPFFYNVEKLQEIETETLFNLENGEYTLNAGKTYQFRILHYDPSDREVPLQTADQTRWIIVDGEGEGLKRVSTSQLAIDSPYDVKTVTFRAPNNTSMERAIVTFFRVKEPNAQPTTDKAIRDFDLQVVIKGNWKWTLFVALIIGGLLSAQQLLTMWNAKGKLETIPIVLTIFFSMTTAIVAAFGLRKPT